MMRVLIFLPWKPVLTETFILNEFDLLIKNGIDFYAYYIYRHEIPNHPKLQKYQKNIKYIPRLPSILWKKLFFIFYYQFKLFFLKPKIYFKILVWLLYRYQRPLLRSYFRLSKFIPDIMNYTPDLIYCHYTYENSFLAFLAKSYLGKNKYFMITHQLNIFEPVFKNTKTDLFPEYMIVKSNYAKRVLLKKYNLLDHAKIKIIPWGIDTIYFKPTNHSTGKIFKILSISRLTEQKGTIFLLKACKILADKKMNFQCDIYGDGEERDKLKQFIDANKLNKIIKIHSFITDQDILLKTYSSADLFVLPCVIDKSGEGDIAPNVVLEAMSMELPIITTKIGGMDEIIENGLNGFIVKERNEVELADTISRVINTPIETRRNIGKAARNTVLKYYNKETLGKKFIKFLNDVNKNDGKKQ